MPQIVYDGDVDPDKLVDGTLPGRAAHLHPGAGRDLRQPQHPGRIVRRRSLRSALSRRTPVSGTTAALMRSARSARSPIARGCSDRRTAIAADQHRAPRGRSLRCAGRGAALLAPASATATTTAPCRSTSSCSASTSRSARRRVASCAAFDRNGDERVAIDELLAGVNNAHRRAAVRRRRRRRPRRRCRPAAPKRAARCRRATGVNLDPTQPFCDLLSSYRFFKDDGSTQEPNDGRAAVRPQHAAVLRLRAQAPLRLAAARNQRDVQRARELHLPGRHGAHQDLLLSGRRARPRASASA